MDVQLPGMDGRRGARPAARRPRHGGHPGRRVHRVRDEGRPRALPRRRLRRLPGEADQRARVPRAGGRAAGGARAGARHDRRRDDPGRRRPAAERPAAGGGARAARLRRRRRRRRATRRSSACASEPVDLVLLDIVMPGMDGYEVCRTLRADEATRFLPVVMITASGEQEKVAAIEAGADDFIAKPFDQAELLARVRSLLRIKRYHDTIEAQAAELADVEPAARAARRGAGRRARADRAAAALPPAAARRARHVVRRRVVPREPPPRDHGRVLRPARLHRVRRDGRARGPDAGARRVPRGAGRSRPPLRGHARALHRATG